MTEERIETADSGSFFPNEKNVRRALDLLALARTVFSSERAVMAWMRTSVSLYAFGFSITKFVAYLQGQDSGIRLPDSARHLGILLIIVAMGALMIAIAEHSRRLRAMGRKGLLRLRRHSLPIMGALGLFVLEILTLISLAWGS